mmetsp:Transcript_25605/g.50169  ORF Transcript_25605/g.50169 Transcript_25605/m.50169 type:complete len:216 (-) Transcript_25605:1407-2054(-)
MSPIFAAASWHVGATDDLLQAVSLLRPVVELLESTCAAGPVSLTSPFLLDPTELLSATAPVALAMQAFSPGVFTSAELQAFASVLWAGGTAEGSSTRRRLLELSALPGSSLDFTAGAAASGSNTVPVPADNVAGRLLALSALPESSVDFAAGAAASVSTAAPAPATATAPRSCFAKTPRTSILLQRRSYSVGMPLTGSFLASTIPRTQVLLFLLQ